MQSVIVYVIHKWFNDVLYISMQIYISSDHDKDQ